MFNLLIFFILCVGAVCAATPADEIVSTYRRLENQFVSIAKERLLTSLNEDPILKENFLTGDSSNYKKLKLLLRPLLKLKKEAEDFNYSEDIFDFIEFDTINFQSVAQFYLDDSLVFYITRNPNKCDAYISLPVCESPIKWCPGDYYFSQNYYLVDKKDDCMGPYFPIYKDSSLIFFIDCFTEGFLISESQIKIYPDDYHPDLLKYLDEPNQFIHKSSDYRWIRFCAMGCTDDIKKP